MAFENLFGNIDFQAQNRMAMAQQQQFAEMLGRGIQAAQTNRQLDMQERQMEQKRNEVNVSKVAENAILKQNMGIPLDAQEQAAIATMGQLAKDQVYFDEFGNKVVQPSPWRSLGRTQGIVPEVGASQITPSIGGAQMAERGEFPAYDTIQDDYVEPKNIPLQPISINDLGGINQVSQTGDGLVDVVSAEGSDFSGYLQQPYTASGALAGTPRGAMMEEESRQKLSEEGAKMMLEQKFQAEKEKRQELKELPAIERKIVSAAYDWKATESVLDDAINSVSGISAGLGSLTSFIPATPAKDLQAKLNTVKADAAFGALQKMRDNSKTGGALGQVSERELALLESAQAPLDQAQSPQQLVEYLENYKKTRRQSLQRVADAFEQDYGYRPKIFGNNSQPSQNGWSIRKK